jgi:hypothetical protein
MAKEIPEKKQEPKADKLRELSLQIITFPWRLLCWFGRSIKLFWLGAWWRKAILIIVGLILALLVASLSVAAWYRASTSDTPLQLGVTFVSDYAVALGVDPDQAYTAILQDLDVNNLRLVSYWNKIEQQQGTYNFDELDKQFAQAEAAGAQISLAIGLRQPRWPECHMPDWAKSSSMEQLEPQLMAYLTAVVSRYKDAPNLQSWQLENEALLGAFGECPVANRDRLQREFDLVRKLDTGNHSIIMSRSNNMPFLVLGAPEPDIVGMSVYRRVWNSNFYEGYFNYPLPSWYYASLAGWQKLLTGKDSVLHEMQMEPWPPSGQFIADVSREEQDKSMNASMFQDRIDFAKNTGMRQIDLWGAEWWYYRKVVLNDNSLWQEAAKTFRDN